MNQSTFRPAYDAIVVGAGISGACAAIALAQRGCKTLLLEAGAFPRHKVCGEFLSPESKAVFHRLKVLPAIIEAGANQVSRIRIIARGGRAVETPLNSTALSISRFALDALLAEAAQSMGVKVLCGARARRLEQHHEVFSLDSTQGEFQARTVLVATGRNPSWLQRSVGNAARSKSSSIATQDSVPNARYLGFKAHFRYTELPLGVVELHAWRGGYCGLVRVEGGLTNVCLLARYEAVAGRAPSEFWPWLLRHLPGLRARMHRARQEFDWLATGNVSFGISAPLRFPGGDSDQENGGVLCCGDAASFIHPLTGDGMAMAARSGELAAGVIGAQLRGGLTQSDAHALYAAAWQREFAARLKWASVFQRLLIDPQLATAALSVAARVPSLSRFAVTATRGSYTEK